MAKMIFSGPDEHLKCKRDFWIWFDSLPTDDKKIMWYHPEDIALLYYYQHIWRPANPIGGARDLGRGLMGLLGI